ncbi:hypothetical protein SH661x_001811 [Planctomicrobium sp. SH661]|uniref:hypothetical protein n=1 Tax=Planctomicrobium sp. SH661 TaxID=3448124 RepID=UPI003F5AF8A7
MRYLILASIGALGIVGFLRQHELQFQRDTVRRSAVVETMQRDSARLAEQQREEFERMDRERDAKQSLERAAREYRADVREIRERERAGL